MQSPDLYHYRFNRPGTGEKNKENEDKKKQWQELSAV